MVSLFSSRGIAMDNVMGNFDCSKVTSNFHTKILNRGFAIDIIEKSKLIRAL